MMMRKNTLRKYSLLIIFIIICVICGCKNEGTIDIIDNDDSEIIKHSIESYRYSVRYYSSETDIRPSYIPKGYNSGMTIVFESVDEFDNFINNKLKEKYDFIFPLIYSDELFNSKRLSYTYYLDSERYNQLIGDKDPHDRDQKILEEIDYDLETGYGEIAITLIYDPRMEDNPIFEDYIKIQFQIKLGDCYLNYLNDEKMLTGEYFDVYDIDNFVYKEIRYQSFGRNVHSVEYFGDNIQIYNNGVKGYIFNISVTPKVSSNVNSQIYEYLRNGQIEEADELIKSIEESNYKEYDYIYNKIIEYGYKTYSNKNK